MHPYIAPPPAIEVIIHRCIMWNRHAMYFPVDDILIETVDTELNIQAWFTEYTIFCKIM